MRLNQKFDYTDKVTVVAHIKNSEYVMALLLTVDAIRRENLYIDLSLQLPYIPYARQDRVCNEGESLSIAVMASLINSCEFSSVHVIDPHSDVAPALIKNVIIKSQEEVFRRIYQDWRSVYIVAPDAGAYKKSHKFAQSVGAAGVVVCNKIRDVKTGKIEGVSCTEGVTGKHLLVLDDICDGGLMSKRWYSGYPTERLLSDADRSILNKFSCLQELQDALPMELLLASRPVYIKEAVDFIRRKHEHLYKD